MSNSLIDEYRASNAEDQRSDEELTVQLGAQFPQLFEQYPDFASDYANIQKQQRVSEATIPGEASKALARGTHGVGSSLAAGMALLSDTVGMGPGRDWWLEAAKGQDEAAAENAAAVPKWEDANTLREKVLYATGAAFSTVPSIAEMGVVSAIGGGVGALAKLGDLTTLFSRQAAKSLLKTGVENLAKKGLIEDAAQAAVNGQLEKVAAGETVGAVMPEVNALVRAESRNAATRHGAQWAAAVNAYGLSSGEIYNNLAADPNVDPDTARKAATLWGIAAAAPDTFLPAYISARVFPSMGHAAASGLAARVFKDAVLEIGGEAATEGLQEIIDVLAERDAKHQQMDAPFSKEDWSRIKNAAIVGGFGGGIAVPFTVMAGGHGKETIPKVAAIPEPPVQPVVPAPPIAPPSVLPPSTPTATQVPIITNESTSPPIGVPAPNIQAELQGELRPNIPAPIPAAPIQPAAVPAVGPVPAEQVPANAIVAPSSLPGPVGPGTIPAEPGTGVPPSAVPSVSEPTQPTAQAQEGSGNVGVPVTVPPVIPKPVEAKPKTSRSLLSRLDVEFNMDGTINPRSLRTVMRVPLELANQWTTELSNFLIGQIGDQTADFQAAGDIADKAPKNESHRATAFRNVNTGEVVVLGTYTLHGNGGVMVAPHGLNSKGEPRKFGTNLKDFMRPGKDLVWTPIESIRFAEPIKYFSESFPSVEAYNAEFSEPANAMMIQARSKASTVESTIQKSGKKKDGSVIVEQPAQQPTNADFDSEAFHQHVIDILPRTNRNDKSPINVNASLEDVAAAIKADLKRNRSVWIPVFLEKKQQLSKDEQFSKLSIPDQSAVISQAISEQVHRGLVGGIYADAAGQGRNFSDVIISGIPDTLFSIDAGGESEIERWHRISNLNQIRATTVFDIKNRLRALVAEIGMPHMQNVARWISGNSGNLEFLKDLIRSDVSSAINNATDSPEKQRFLDAFQSLGEIDQISTSEMPSYVERLKRLISEFEAIQVDPARSIDAGTGPRSASTPEVRARFGRLIGTLQNRGLNVRTLQAIGQELGSFTKSERLITLSLFDADNPTPGNLRLALHEAAHDLFSEEAPQVQERILKAIDSLSDADLGITESQDPRIRQSNPSGLSQGVLALERLVEALAQNGIGREPARGIAAKIIRFIKDLYYRVAMAVQSAYGKTPSGFTSLAYLRNRFEQLEAGERRLSVFDFVTPPEDSFVREQRFRNEYALPDVLYSKPVSGERPGDRENPEVIPNTRIATLNAQKDLETKASAIMGALPSVDKAVAKANVSVGQWFRDLVGLENPDDMIRDAVRTEDPATGLPVNANPNFALGGFKSSVNNNLSNNAAYSFLRRQMDKIGDKIKTRQIELGDLTKQRVDRGDELAKSVFDYMDVKRVTDQARKDLRKMLRSLYKDVAKESKSLGVISQQLVELGETGNELAVWAPVFRRLFTGDELGAKRLVDTLDILATDLRIDLSRRADSIRNQMRKTGDSKFDPFLSDTQEGKALLATAIAYARTNRSAAWFANLRKMTDLDRRAKIVEQLKKDLNETLPEAQSKISELVDTGKLEDQLRQAFLKDRRDWRRLRDRENEMQAELEALKAAFPFWQQKVNELGGKLEIRTDKVFGHGFETFSPPSDTATEDQVRGNKVVVSIKKGGEITSRATIQGWIDAITPWLANRELVDNMDEFYWQMRSDLGILLRDGVFNPDIINTNHSVTRLFFMGMGDQVKAFGTIAGRMLNKTVTHFTGAHEALRREYTPMAVEAMRRRQTAINILTGDDQRGLIARTVRPNPGLSIENYWSNFFEPAVKYLEDNRDILESEGTKDQQWERAFQKVLNNLLLNPAARDLMAGKEQRFINALRAHIEAVDAISRSLSAKLNDEGVGVYEESTEKTRMRLERGLTTIPQTISGIFRNVFEKLHQSGWDGFDEALKKGFSDTVENIGQTYQSLGAEDTRKHLAKFFSDSDVIRQFLVPIVNMPTQSRFKAPAERDGVTRREVHPADVQIAWGSAGGDIIRFAENLYDVLGGAMDKGAYVQQTLEVFSGYYEQMQRLMRKLEPERFGRENAEFSTMVPGFMVNARQVEDMPAEWFRHLDFDENTMHRATGKVAAEIAFGVHGGKLETNFQTLLEETHAEVAKLDNAIEAVNHLVITNDRKARDKALADRVGGMAELKRLRQLKQKEAKILIPWKKDLVTFFRGANSPIKTLRFTQQVANLVSGLMVNQLGSAISNLSDVLSHMIPLGVSPTTLRSTLRQTKGITSEVGRSFAQAFGIAIDRSSREYQRMIEYGQGDPAAMWRNSDLLLKQTGPDESMLDRISQGLRTTQRAIQFGINPREGKVSPFRPLAPFSQVGFNTNQEAVINWQRDIAGFVRSAVEHLKTAGLSRAAIADMTLAEWAEELDMSKAEANTFQKMFSILRDDAGIDFSRMALEGTTNVAKGEDIVSKRNYLLIQGAALKATGNETSISTMPSWAFVNSLARVMLPLISWNFRRARDVSGLHLDESGKIQIAAIQKAIVTMAVMMGGGLAISMLVDFYNEEMLNKRRNLRRLTPNQDPSELAMALLEHSARVGTFGLWGDVLNSALNTGTGQGDNRGVSLDSRIVAVNSAIGVLKALSTWKNQSFTADYTGVIRPLAYSVGGGGMIQYLQLANNLAGLDNAESRATARTNVGNWLRAVGREQGLEIAQSKGGYATPTPMTPLITRMTLAAYGNDAGDFNMAFREAVAEAKKEGKDDPVKYVRTMFMSRAPIRSVFRNPMSEQDYRRVLSAMPEDGRQAVQDAVRMFDGYTRQIGGTPHELARVKSPPAVTLRMPSARSVNPRSAAASALTGTYGF